MKTFYNHLHAQHQGKVEMFRGALVPCFEVPARADHVLAELKKRKFGAIVPPESFDDNALLGIHSQRYLDFLAGAWDEWVALDMKYIQERSFWVDWKIIFLTVRAMLMKYGE